MAISSDESGNFDWATPDEEGFAFINDLERPIGMYLYGRKMYRTMAIWQTPDVIPPDVIPGGTPAMLDFARTWQTADKIVIPNRWRRSLHRRCASSGNSTRRRFAT
jgi:hypothetical protein